MYILLWCRVGTKGVRLTPHPLQPVITYWPHPHPVITYILQDDDDDYDDDDDDDGDDDDGDDDDDDDNDEDDHHHLLTPPGPYVHLDLTRWRLLHQSNTASR